MKKIKYLFVTVGFIISMVSCEIERFPYDKIEQTQAFKTMTDAATLRNGLYAHLRNRTYGIFMFSTDVQADLLNATLDYGNRNGFPHRWDGFLSTDYTIRDVWRYYYFAISNVNNFIQNIDKIETKNDTEKATIAMYKGEAYFLRAFYYHQLVIRWGKPYNASSASSDLGVPLVLEYDPTLKPSRATVQQVYDQIISDLNSAKSLLPDVTTVDVTRISKDAVFALESRVYLHMKDYPKVITAAESLIGSSRYPLVSTIAGLKAIWVNDSPNESILQINASAPTELLETSAWTAINNIYLGWNPATSRYTPDFIPEQWVVDLFDVSDIRRDVYLIQAQCRIQAVDYNLYLLNKYPGNPALFTGASTNYQHKPKVLRIAEVYLNLAEAQYYVNQGDALNTLNALKTNRGLASVTLSDAALLDEIRAERTRELLGEGFRLNDLMRWNLGVTRTAPQNTDCIQRGTTYDALTKAAGDPKFIWGVPQNDLTTNTNLVQNNGW